MGGITPETQQPAVPHNVMSVYITLVKSLTKWYRHINRSFRMRQSV